jgi:hypothetical protein
MRGADAVAHGARALPPRATAPAAVGHDAGNPAAVPHGGRNLAPPASAATVGGTSNAVPHGGRNSWRRGVRRQMYISRKF